MKTHRLSILLTVTCSLLLLAACGEKPAQTPPESSTSQKTPAPPTPEVLARLAQADAADGKTDKLVEKCAGCALSMSGKADKELAVGDYKLHLCSDGCLEKFRADPNGQIMAMKMSR